MVDALVTEALNNAKLREALGGVAMQTQPPNPFPVKEVDPPVAVRGKVNLDLLFPADTVYTSDLETLKSYVLDVLAGQQGPWLPKVTIYGLELWKEVERAERPRTDWARELRAAAGPEYPDAGSLAGIYGGGLDGNAGRAGHRGVPDDGGQRPEAGDGEPLANPDVPERDADAGDTEPSADGIVGAGQDAGGPDRGTPDTAAEASQGWDPSLDVETAPDPFEGITALLQEEKARLKGV